MSVLDSELNKGARIEYSDSVEKGQEVTHPEDEYIKEMEDTRAAIPNEDDPLYWHRFRKIYIVGLISLMSFVGQMGGSMINPAFILLADELGVTVTKASYLTTVNVLFGGVTPMFIVPYANVYGRRNLYVFFLLIASVSNIGSAVATSWGGVFIGRLFTGVGSSIPLGLGAATICDLFVQGERGFFMGIYTLSVTNGPHVSPIIGGFLAKRLGWRWCLWLPAIMQGALCVIAAFTLPETLFSRKTSNALIKRSYFEKLVYYKKVLPDRKIVANDYITPYRMIRYLAVTLPAAYFMTTNTYGSALFAITGAKIAASVYGFDVAQTGLFIGLPLTIGCMLAEATTGWISDLIVNAYSKRHSGYRKPEARLFLLPFCLLLPIGTATYGYCIEHKRPWIEAAICMAVSGWGCQVGATVVYTYTTDSYKPQSGEIGAVINLFKSCYAFNVGFYALPLMGRIGYSAGFSTLAAINFTFLLPLFFLIFNGRAIRDNQGVPKEHQDL